jgi:hypothetical protein
LMPQFFLLRTFSCRVNCFNFLHIFLSVCTPVHSYPICFFLSFSNFPFAWIVPPRGDIVKGWLIKKHFSKTTN